MDKYDIAQIGIYPPPYGGISIHIKRLKQYLDKDKVTYIIYTNNGNDYKKNDRIFNVRNQYVFYFTFYIINKCKIVHYHDLNWKKRFLLSFLKPKKIKLIFTFHSFRDDIYNINYIYKYMHRVVYKKANVIIAVSQSIKEKLIQDGCDENKIKVVPAIIFPLKIQDVKKDEHFKSIKKFQSLHNIIFIANSSNNNHFNGEDLYGIDMCIELVNKFHQKNINVGFLFFISNISDRGYFDKLNKLICRYTINDNFMFINSKVELIAYIKEISDNSKDIFLRPTNTDGDAISIREALYLKIPVIASDVVQRPEGTILFKTRDIENLYNKTVHVIENYDLYKEKLGDIKIEDNSEKILDIYKKLMNS
ncbi:MULTISPECIES: glycosyltransferase family 4 protein [Clostridium]|uniref:Glycosyltransferase family 4 protein n=1 Tax=Clostridium lapidicellarium TaxID=3240931 RepID=A0ABV4DZN9_9CLOT